MLPKHRAKMENESVGAMGNLAAQAKIKYRRTLVPKSMYFRVFQYLD